MRNTLSASGADDDLANIVDLAQLGPLYIISPHLDDAILSCGALLSQCPGSTIVTMLAGDAPESGVRTAWDAAAGFVDAAEAMSTRRAEDRAAAAWLSADTKHLDFPDGQYDPHVPIASLAAGLTRALNAEEALPAPGTILLPMGLFHADHIRVAQAWQHAAVHWPSQRMLVYEDQPYRSMGHALLDGLSALRTNGWQLAPVRWRLAPDALPLAVERKKRALQAYASQLRVLPPAWVSAALASESYWHLWRDDTSSARLRD